MSEFSEAVNYWGPMFVVHHGDECQCPWPNDREVVNKIVRVGREYFFRTWHTGRCAACHLLCKSRLTNDIR